MLRRRRGCRRCIKSDDGHHEAIAAANRAARRGPRKHTLAVAAKAHYGVGGRAVGRRGSDGELMIFPKAAQQRTAHRYTMIKPAGETAMNRTGHSIRTVSQSFAGPSSSSVSLMSGRGHCLFAICHSI